ncbi:MAG TPA: fluoride efflux transporter CrcB, partial [Acidobacteriaceae bacterium]|nr:fluoride efflux transporter CrcB [Acidobacteriaceae bacterium]
LEREVGYETSVIRGKGDGTVLKYFYMALGGAAGAIARYWLGSLVTSRMGTRFPYGTFVINMTACLILGFVLTFLSRRSGWNMAWTYLIPIGFVGAYSTFSTYEWEMLSTLRSGAFSLAALYTFGSLILGLVAVWCGIMLAEVLG